MQMESQIPGWLTPVAWIFLALALASAVAIAFDIYARRHRHTTLAAELVWITSALYLGPLGLALYGRSGRSAATTDSGDRAAMPHDADQSGAVPGLPGGSASAVAHLIGVPLVIASGVTIAGINLWVMILVIGVLAIALLFAYERAAANGRRGGVMPVGTALAAAVITVLAFDIGMAGWMLLLHFNESMPPATDATFWFLMQIGVVLGLATGYPAVRWLARRRRTVVPA
jgi:hypothetical protein